MDFHDEHTVEHEPLHTSDVESGASRRFSLAKLLSGRRVHLITDAKRSPEQNLRHRESMYKWLQGSRIPFLLASGVTYMWMHSIILSTLLFIISIPLPWIAVVVANGVGEPKDPRTPAVYKPALARQEAEYQQLSGSQQAAIAAGRQPSQHEPRPQDSQRSQQNPDSFGGQIIDHESDGGAHS